VVDGKTPKFLTVSDVLRQSVDNTLQLLKRELEIHRSELQDSLHFASLERIFIEERIYKDKQFENAKSVDEACAHIDERLTPFYPQFIREVTKDDILKLLEIKMARILKFNKDKAEEAIARMNQEIEGINKDLQNMVEVTCNWFTLIRDKYAAAHPRRTEIRSFDTIEASKVIEANEKLYINRTDGFIGTSLKKDEFVSNCSNIDDVIIFYRDGTYKVTRVAEKVFVGETEKSKQEKRKAEIIHIAVFKKNDARTIYNVVYRDGKTGPYYIKRFNVTSITHDREYDVTTGEPGSRINYFTANPNGEAEVIKVTLKPNPKLKKIFFDKDFSEILVKGRQSRGNLLTKNDIYRLTLKSQGGSTLGGRKVWFDHDVQRLNYDERGEYLGEFHSEDLVLVILKNGEFYTTNFDPNNHYETDLLRIEKFDESKVWTAMLFDADQQGFLYVKRFTLERTAGTRHQSMIGDNPNTELLLLTDTVYPRLQVSYGGLESYRDPLEIDAEQFIGVKSYKAKGKRVTTLTIDGVEELEPLRFPEPEEEEQPVQANIEQPTDLVDEEGNIIDENTGQIRLPF
jgi:topoisomerase-4 subunit A